MRPGADFHFIAGFDHYRAGRISEARREWKTCLELDATHDFCEFGLSALDAGSPKEAGEKPTRPEAAVTEAAPTSDRDANQAYLEGVIYYQKGDYEKARDRWLKSRDLAPKGSDVSKDAKAGLEKLDVLFSGKSPASLKDAPEKKDEHEALQTYFTGLIHYQKGDMDRARIEWRRALSLAPKGSSVEADAKAALEKLDKDEASTRDGRNK
jgi:Flp pilus assembly protein TadD